MREAEKAELTSQAGHANKLVTTTVSKYSISFHITESIEFSTLSL